MVDPTGTHRVHGYCALCIARCGCVAVVEDGRFTRLEPDPAHPIGQALCAKGRAAPELVYHPERLTHPLRRTRPKGDPDPGWERIDWDEALDLIAAAMRRIAERQGPEAVAFSMCSGSTFAGTRGNGRDAPIPVIAGAARLHPKQSFVAHRQWAFRGLLGDIPLIDVEQSVFCASPQSWQLRPSSPVPYKAAEGTILAPQLPGIRGTRLDAKFREWEDLL